MSYEDLSNVLRSYGIRHDQDALQAAFSQGPQASEWVRRHLNPDTLLTRNELDQYEALARAGAEARLDLDATAQPPPVGDADLRAAIDELNRSTAAVSKQAEALRQQQDALARIMSQAARAADARAEMAARRARTAEAELRQLVAEVEVLAQSLGSRIADFEAQQGNGGSLQQTVDRLLDDDDKLLASLQKLGWELEAEDPDDQEGVVKLRETCARLIKYTVETLRTKLDRVYIEALESAGGGGPRQQQPANVSTEELGEMQAELEELYSEILPVAQMSVEQQFLEPAVQSLTGRSVANVARSAEALDYVDGCLSYLLHNIQSLSARAQDYRAHEAATSVILSAAKAELAAASPHTAAGAAMPSKSRTRATTLNSPTHRYPMAAGVDVSPVRLRRAQTNPRADDAAAAAPPLEALLRSLALTLPADDVDPAADVAALSKALRDRTAKASDMARNVQASFEGAAASHLVDAAAAVAALRDSVLAESTGDSAAARDAVVSLTDPETESSIWVLQQEVSRVRGRLGDVEAQLRMYEGVGRAKGSSTRDQLVKRWGSRVT